MFICGQKCHDCVTCLLVVPLYGYVNANTVCCCPKTQCQQELDQVLERISKMPFRDNRGPLEDLYALHIPNCDKRGQYNLKQVSTASTWCCNMQACGHALLIINNTIFQCKMSLHGQRGECWCVNPHTGQPIPSAPTVRGDPNCSQYLRELELELELPDAAQI